MGCGPTNDLSGVPKERTLEERVGRLCGLAWQKAVVALANKNARILWAVMTKGEAFDANHQSLKPAGA